MWSLQCHHCYKKKGTTNAHNNWDESPQKKANSRVTYYMAQFIGYALNDKQNYRSGD